MAMLPAVGEKVTTGESARAVRTASAIWPSMRTCVGKHKAGAGPIAVMPRCYAGRHNGPIFGGSRMVRILELLELVAIVMAVFAVVIGGPLAAAYGLGKLLGAL